MTGKKIVPKIGIKKINPDNENGYKMMISGAVALDPGEDNGVYGGGISAPAIEEEENKGNERKELYIRL
jgi:hypothetical protein